MWWYNIVKETEAGWEIALKMNIEQWDSDTADNLREILIAKFKFYASRVQINFQKSCELSKRLQKFWHTYTVLFLLSY